MRRVVIVVCSLLAWSCGSDPDYGPPPTCLAGEEGLGRWEYLPTPHYERNLVDPQGTGPLAPSRGTMVWTGTHVLMWGKDQGAALDPTAAPADRWKPLPTENGPGERSDSAVSVWTGSQWLVWGGEWRPSPGAELVPRNDGAMYDPETGTWEPMPMEGAPLADDLEAVWTGSEVIVWGAAEDEAGDCEHRAGAFDPNTRTWRAIPLQGTPFERKWKPTTNELAKNLCQPPPRAWRGPLIWTGNELLVWDAIGAGGTQAGVYYPEDDRWRVIDVSGGPLPRWQAYWAWTGGELLVWGGRVPDGSIGRGVVTGGLYDLGTQTWRSMNSEDAPDGMNAAGRAGWTGQDLLVPAGESGCPVGARYNLETDTWSAMARSPSEFYRRDTTTVLWAGSAMLIWGGSGHHATFFDGALYYP